METTFAPEAFQRRHVHGSGNQSTISETIQDASLVVRFDNGVLADILSTDSYGNDFWFTVMGDKAVMRFKTNPWLPVAGDNLIEIKPYGGPTQHVMVEGSYDAFGYQV